MTFETYETPVTEQSGLRYKIQVRYFHGLWQQRHVWYPCEHSAPAWGGAANYYHEEEWIKTVPQRKPIGWKRVGA